jgi:hypothetical protein
MTNKATQTMKTPKRQTQNATNIRQRIITTHGLTQHTAHLPVTLRITQITIRIDAQDLYGNNNVPTTSTTPLPNIALKKSGQLHPNLAAEAPHTLTNTPPNNRIQNTIAIYSKLHNITL